jgi:cobalamin-dependent methionine synthase I
MKTRVSSAKKEDVISDSRPTMLIGKRINPMVKKRMAEAFKEDNLKVLLDEAKAQRYIW